MATPHMAKKRKRKLDTTGSFSFVETEQLKSPTEVLALGRHLVNELGLEPGVDTLGRWMAHHVAELMNKAETGATEEVRTASSERAVATILRIWDHRAALPGNAYPLAPYKEALRILDNLRPQNNPFRFSPQEGIPLLASEVFSDLSRLVVALLLMEQAVPRTPPEVDVAALDALSDEERRALEALMEWSKVLPPPRHGETLEKARGDAEHVVAVTLRLVDHALSTLDEVRTALLKSVSPEG